MIGDCQVTGTNKAAPFTLKAHRGDGMVLLAMNWKQGKPPLSFVGFAIEYKEPGGDQYYPLKNRLCFPNADKTSVKDRYSTLRSPIQKFRWVHFPYDADKNGDFTYRVTPVFMDANEELSYGEAQTVLIGLARETYPGQLNVAFTRGFISSQAFVDSYAKYGSISALIPGDAKDGLGFAPTHPKTKQALTWMGFEARSAILDVLDKALADPDAGVKVVAFELNEPGVFERLQKLGSRLKIIIDDSKDHREQGSAENQAQQLLSKAAVKRQHMGSLQHNKTIVVDGPKTKYVVCGSTNFSWRGFYVQSNNAVVLQGDTPVKLFGDAFDNYWNHGSVKQFGATPSARWNDLGLQGIDAAVGFSPHASGNALLQEVADDIVQNARFERLLFPCVLV